MMFAVWPLTSMAIDAAEYLDDAQKYFDKGEYSTAVIQLKNALQADPDNGEARLLLGKTYLKLENGPSALKELSRARDLGVGRKAVLLPLGRAYLMAGQGDQLLQAITREADDLLQIRIDILLLHGQAYLGKQHFAMADEKFSKVLELRPAAAGALAGKARIAFHDGDTAGAAELADKAIAEDDQVVDAWIIKGELFRQAGKHREAVSAFQKALDITPTDVPARLGKAIGLIGLGEQDNALAEIEQLLKSHPDMYMAHYVKALALYQQHQLAQAQESVQRTLKLAPGHLKSHLLAGTISYQQGQLNQSEQHLRQYLRQRPGDKQAAKLLAATLLKLRKPGAAIEVLEPGMSSASDDAQYFSLLGSAYLGQGDAASGLEYLEKAIALAPDSANMRTQLAIGYLALGEEEQAIGELQTAVDLDQGLLKTDVLLAMAYLRNKDFDAALVAAEALTDKMPGSPVPDNLKGAAQLGKGNRKAARNAYEAALKIQPDFLPAYFNLARLDQLANNPAAAEGRYRKVLSYDEGNLKALLALAVLASREGRVDETEKWLKRAHRHHPEAAQPALMLVKHYQRRGKTIKALDLARATAITHSRDQEVLKTLAFSQLKAGEDKAALTTLRSLVELVPQPPGAHYQLALVQLKLEKSDEARESLRQALTLEADYPAAQLALGRLEIVRKNSDAARDIADALKQVHPDAVFGYELEGDIFYSRQAFKRAAGAYALAAGKTNSAPLARKLFQSRLKAGEHDAAYEALRQWLAEHPEDTTLRAMLAMALQSAGQQQSAIEEYQQVLEYDADNVAVLNNLAWLYQEAGSPEGVKYAERAHELVPDRPDVSDTLGWLLVQNGEINRGLVLLQDAAVKAPHIPDIRYHMIVALDRAGRRDEARKELNRLLKTGKVFPDIDKARALREQWGG
ncbi:MAG: PEP-CTERM system TPR-repeat protein PrsT [Gammaproteobacteria bacterium]|nr:MAG: PEP-CTERM system TPR-repeat protein PrsT [Gammaproteobacteria bacterium]